MGVIEEARALRSQMEEVAKTIPDDTAPNYVKMFQKWSGDSISYSTGVRVRHDDVLYRCLQSHTSQPTWSPDTAPSLWTKVLAGQEGTEIGEWEQPDSTNPYNKGDKVRFEGKVYESLIDGNVWSPTENPTGWTEVEE